MKIGVGGLIMALIFSVSFPVLGAGDFNIIKDDYYTAGETVNVENKIMGDVIAAGYDINIKNEVGGDVALAGYNINILNNIGDDARVAGYAITVEKIINDDLMVAGNSLKILPEALIRGDVSFMGAEVVIDGNINGNLEVASDKVVINGKINGNVSLNNIDEKTLVLGEKAVILGDLSYEAKEPLVGLENGKVKGKVNYNKLVEVVDKKEAVSDVINFFSIISLLALLVSALVLMGAFKNLTLDVVKNSSNSFGKSLGLGILTLIFLPLSVLLMFFSGIFSWLAIMLIAVFVIILMLAKIYSGIVLMGIVSKILGEESFVLTWWKVVLGVLIVYVLGLAPFFWFLWLITFLLFLVSLGTFIRIIYKFLLSKRV